MPSTYKALGSIFNIRVGVGIERGFIYVLFVPIILVFGRWKLEEQVQGQLQLSIPGNRGACLKETKTSNEHSEGKVKILEGSVGLLDHFTVSYVHLTCFGSLRSLIPRLFKTGQVWLSCRDELVPFLEFWL